MCGGGAGIRTESVSNYFYEYHFPILNMFLYFLVICSDGLFCDIIGLFSASVSLSWPLEAEVEKKPHINYTRLAWCLICSA